MFQAKDVVTTRVPAIKGTTAVGEVTEILLSGDIGGQPVVNEDMTLAGIVSEKDVIRLLSDFQDNSAKVEDPMTKDVVCFDEDTDLTAVCESRAENNFRRSPIVSRGRLLGPISRTDIIEYIPEPTGQITRT
jgi:CBS domain-containing protein